MEYQIKSKISEKSRNFPNYAKFFHPKYIKLEENKNYFKSKTSLNNNSPNHNYNINKNITPRNNDKLYPIIRGYTSPYKDNFINDNKTIFQNKNDFNNINYNVNFKTIHRKYIE